MAIQKCKECGEKVSTKAKACPSCGAPVKSQGGCTTGCLGLFAVGAVVLVCAGLFSNGGSSSSPSSNTRSSNTSTSRPKTPKIETPKIKTRKVETPKVETRKKKIERSFSAWDGSHRQLTKVIKSSMNDPSSYDHVETTYWDRGDHLVVRTTFRGKNAFGGVVKNWVKAKVNIDGTVLEIIEQGP